MEFRGWSQHAPVGRIAALYASATAESKRAAPRSPRRLADGARGRDRTGMGLPPRDFLTRYGFRRCAGPNWLRAFGVWTFSLPFRRGMRDGAGRGRQVSTLSGRAAPGLARDCRHRGRRSCFPEFDPIHAGGFPPGCSIDSSPLRLPVSPPGRRPRARIAKKKARREPGFLVSAVEPDQARRRRPAASPTRPSPRSASEPGSGAASISALVQK